jgi:hypothetical protein
MQIILDVFDEPYNLDFMSFFEIEGVLKKYGYK